MKIAAFVSSPNVEGNTVKLTESILKGAGDAGAEILLLNIHDRKLLQYGIKGDDDFSELYEHFTQSETVIFASPVWMWHVTGQMKTFWDRLLEHFDEEFKHKSEFPVKIMMAYTQAAQGDSTFETYFDMVENFWRSMGFKICPRIVCSSTEEKTVVERPDIQEKAASLGRGLVEVRL